MTDDEPKCETCDSAACPSQAAGRAASPEEQRQEQLLAERLAQIKQKILVLSGKGGVGKSTVAANLAVLLAEQGHRVGLLDVDIHGPSIPKLLHLEGHLLQGTGEAIRPVAYSANLAVVSMGFLLRSPDEAVIWRGPLKMGAIRQFLRDVAWGELDYLIVDSPPGTGDEPLSICQLLGDANGAVVVTTPQDVAISDVRRCVAFCGSLGVPVLGVVENMSGFVCPHCHQTTDLFKRGGGRRMAEELGVPFLGSVPIDPQVVASCDDGKPFAHFNSAGPTAQAFAAIVGRLVGATSDSTTPSKETATMKIAIPTAEGKLCLHFGHCQLFAIVTVEDGEITATEMLEPPAHEPGALPRWLAEQGASLVITGGMGQRAQGFFQRFGIDVIVGAQPAEPETVVRAYLAGTLATGDNVCDH